MSGWSLIEMLIVISVVAVLVAAGAPTVEALRAQIAVRAALADTISFLNTSRSDALTLNQVELCSDYGCSSFPWSRRMEAFAENGDLIGTLELPPGVQIRWRGFRGTSLVFHARGRLKFQNGHLLICHQTAHAHGQKVILNWIGRARWERARPEDCWGS